MSRDKYPGVGDLGRLFLKFFHPAPEQGPLFGPASSWTQRKPKPSPPDAYAPKIVRHHQEWPGSGAGPQHEPWPYQRWPGERQ